MVAGRSDAAHRMSAGLDAARDRRRRRRTCRPRLSIASAGVVRVPSRRPAPGPVADLARERCRRRRADRPVDDRTADAPTSTRRRVCRGARRCGPFHHRLGPHRVLGRSVRMRGRRSDTGMVECADAGTVPVVGRGAAGARRRGGRPGHAPDRTRGDDARRARCGGVRRCRRVSGRPGFTCAGDDAAHRLGGAGDVDVDGAQRMPRQCRPGRGRHRWRRCAR